MHARSLFIHSPLGLGGLGSVGTAFICQVDTGRYLVTAAHVPSGMHAVNGKFEIPKFITVKSPRRSQILRLYNLDGSPRFLTEVKGGYMSDILILPINRDIYFPGVEEFPLHESLAATDVGSQLSMFGFPGTNKETPVWPEKRVRLLVLIANDRVLNTLEEIEPGASGAPCLTQAGKLAGMAIGSDHGKGTLISSLVIRSIITSSQHGLSGG